MRAADLQPLLRAYVVTALVAEHERDPDGNVYGLSDVLLAVFDKYPGLHGGIGELESIELAIELAPWLTEEERDRLYEGIN